MAKVKCEYCGNYINDLDPICPVCGARNKDHKRTADGTPKTIEELKSWYIARNLPPEETTRFFIGKNIKEPKAFGIYEENGIFVVYKNKANGQRAIRYQGTDEAYAVNELYLRLKEEILNQKNINVNKRRSTVRTNNYHKRRNKSLLSTLILIIMFNVFLLNFGVPAIVNFNRLGNISSMDYYLSDDGIAYYNEGYNNGAYEWWIYDKDSGEWNLYGTYDDKKTLPPNVKKQNKYSFAADLAEKLGIPYDEFSIYNSKNYIDAGHHLTPDTSYYYYDNNLYYFLDDNHSYWGNTDNSGWYKYNDNDTWEYYCDAEDKEKLGEDLYYSEDDYSVGNNIQYIYDYNDSLSTSWNPTSFTSTSWYHSYQENNYAYEKYQEENRNDNYNDWSNDSDWDWDSGSDWDSGGTDWDSDW